MRGYLLLALAVCVAIVHAVSNADPANIYNCDAMSSLWGCDPRFWTNGNRLQCQNKTTQLMPWATKTIRSNCYHVIVGEESNPVTSYVPNEYLQVHIRVSCYKMLYRGLLIYAVNSNEKKIGAWEIPVTEPPFFQQPWLNMPDHECAPSVMHATAEWKAYHSVLYFKAPPAGTGSITFRTLIKYGNANTGDFFWPQTDPVLTEGTPKATSISWQQSAPGQSCSEACGDISCSEEALQGLKDESSLIQNIVPSIPCQVPLLSGCGTDGATYDPVNEYCYYVDSTCAAQNRTQSSVTCDTKQDGVVRLCPCDSDYMSPASHNSPGLLSMLFIIPFLLAGLNQRVVFGLLLVSGFTFAHNWIASVSRSPAASTYRPCKPPLTDLPHAQVGPNQPFQIEWMNGHGDFTYFVIVHSRDADKLKLHTTKMLNDYIAKAPNGSNQALVPNLQKFHLKSNPSLNNEVTENNVTNYFQSLITVNSSLHIPRPSTFGNRGWIYQFQYKPQELAQDVRVSYRSTDYPWIEAVYKFKISTLNPGRADTTNFFIPGYGGPGRYIVQYLWRGYYDCVDVDYKTAQVADVYGIPFNGTRWTRIDHCLFENVQRVFVSSRIYTDPRACLNSCTGGDCYGVNVVPLMAPSSAYPGFRAPGNDTVFPNIFGTDIYVPWSNGHFNNTRGLYTQNAAPNKFMCYGVRPRDFTDTQDEYTISNDPDDPIFYSTCFYRFRGNLFEDYLNNTVGSLNIPWKYSSGCIDCKSKAANTDAYNLFPKWTSPDVCVNCDKEPATLTAPTAPIVVEAGVRCDGSTTGVWSRGSHHTCNNNGTNCWKTLRATGRASASVTLDECRALAEEDSSCSNHFVYRAASSACSCYTKDACCLSCSRRPDATFTTYEKASTPDPTCARGIRAADNSACCSASCGAGNCRNNTMAAIVDQVGFCCSGCITRPCSQFGPPCKL